MSKFFPLLMLLSCGSMLYAEVTPAEITVVPPITRQRVLPDTAEIIGVKDHHLFIAASPGEFENCSFVVKAGKNFTSLNVRTENLTGPGGAIIPADKIDVRLIKCWYQDLGSGYNEKVPAYYYDPTCANQVKTLVPELLLKDDGLIKVDNESQQNYLRLTKDGKTAHSLLSGTAKGQGHTGAQFIPADDSATLKPVALPSGRNQQYYVTIEVEKHIKPGLYRGNITLTEKGDTVMTLPLALRVLPINLPSRGHEISSVYHNMPYLRQTREGILNQYRREVTAMKKHGIDNPGIGGGSIWVWKSNVVTLKDLLNVQKEAGIDISRSFFFMVGYHAEDSLSEEGRQRLAAAKKMAEEAGVKELYIYSHDEALAGCYDMKKMHKAMLEASKMGVKTSGAGIPAGYMDDWRSPGNIGFLGDVQNLMICLGYPKRDEAAKWHAKGQKITCYSNPMHGLEQPDAYRRNFGLLLWQYNYDGAFNYAEPGWGDFWSQAYKRHAFAYPTQNGFIETVQFEGYREGMDDVRYIKTLEKLLKDRPDDKSQASEDARNYLRQLKQGDINRDVNDSNMLRIEIIEKILQLTNRK